MDIQQIAIGLANDDFRVFPLQPNSKRPPKGFPWKDLATSNVTLVTAWWTGLYRGHNIAIATGGGLIVLDCDVKNGKQGLSSLEDLDMLAGLPRSLRVRTPSGGIHIYLRVPPGLSIANSVDAMPGFPGIDVRGDGGYVVGPGSTLDAGVYEVIP